MFTRVVALATAASLFIFAAAAPGGYPTNSQCNGGEIHCCNQTQDVKHTDQKTTLLMQLLGLDASKLTGVVGTTCSPISALAISGNSCTAQQVCCQNNKFNGLIVVGCTPINVSL